MIIALRSLFLEGFVTTASVAGAEATRFILSFDGLDGRAVGDYDAALRVFLNSCGDLDDPGWQAPCGVARAYEPEAALTLFELFIRPVLSENGNAGLFTGYFDSELDETTTPTAKCRYLLYCLSPEERGVGWRLGRRESLTGDAMTSRGPEIARADGPVELYFLQAQGSGRIRLPDGGARKVGYGGTNGHRYRSNGADVIRRGALGAHEVSARMIRNNPERSAELLFHNQLYDFFREATLVAPKFGPLDAMNRLVITIYSIAADSAFMPLDVPVRVENDGKNPLRLVMIAHDTGATIKCVHRTGYFPWCRGRCLSDRQPPARSRSNGFGVADSAGLCPVTG